MLLYIRNCEYKFVLLSHYLSFFTVSFIFRYFQKCRTHPGCTSINQRTPAQLRLYNIPILSGKVLERRSGKVPCGIRKKKDPVGRIRRSTPPCLNSYCRTKGRFDSVTQGMLMQNGALRGDNRGKCIKRRTEKKSKNQRYTDEKNAQEA